MAHRRAQAGDVVLLYSGGRDITPQPHKHRNLKTMQRSSDSFFAVRIDFGDYVRNLQYTDRRTAELVLQQSRIQYGYDNAALVEIKY